MSEEGASFAVLGVDIEALGSAVGRHWGLEDAVLLMFRRLPLAAPVHHADTDEDMLRLAASCANEVVDSRGVPVQHRTAFLQRVVQRYGRLLGIGLRDVQQAAQGVSPEQAEAGDVGDAVDKIGAPLKPGASPRADQLGAAS
jgi:hypothetical protein